LSKEKNLFPRGNKKKRRKQSIDNADIAPLSFPPERLVKRNYAAAVQLQTMAATLFQSLQFFLKVMNS
jgi:hypothetical protein